jgi:hypothetical protein
MRAREVGRGLFVVISVLVLAAVWVSGSSAAINSPPAVVQCVDNYDAGSVGCPQWFEDSAGNASILGYTRMDVYRYPAYRWRVAWASSATSNDPVGGWVEGPETSTYQDGDSVRVYLQRGSAGADGGAYVVTETSKDNGLTWPYVSSVPSNGESANGAPNDWTFAAWSSGSTPTAGVDLSSLASGLGSVVESGFNSALPVLVVLLGGFVLIKVFRRVFAGGGS